MLLIKLSYSDTVLCSFEFKRKLVENMGSWSPQLTTLHPFNGPPSSHHLWDPCPGWRKRCEWTVRSSLSPLPGSLYLCSFHCDPLEFCLGQDLVTQVKGFPLHPHGICLQNLMRSGAMNSAENLLLLKHVSVASKYGPLFEANNMLVPFL